MNLSRLVRTASCCGISTIVVAGNARIDPEIARDGAERVAIQRHRTLLPALQRFRREEIPLIGLEQTDDSANLHTFAFPRRCVLVIGSEREGLADDVLAILNATVEIPVYGLPYSYNVATATAMALYEYCRQYPSG